jgi:signal transduction histidine kinase
LDAHQESAQPAGRYAVVEIFDDGPPPTATERAAATAPFSTLRGTPTRLAIAAGRGVMRAHHGLLTIEARDDAPGLCWVLAMPISED